MSSSVSEREKIISFFPSKIQVKTMKIYKISARLLFSVLLSYIDFTEKNLVNYKDINSKVKNKLASRPGTHLRKINPEYIKNLTNCVGNAIFKKKQEIYYTKLENIYPLFYGWQSSLRNMSKFQNIWEVIEENLEKNNHHSESETKRFSAYQAKAEFEKSVYKAYKKMTWALLDGKGNVKQ